MGGTEVMAPAGARVIPLTKGAVAWVDGADYGRVMERKWYCAFSKVRCGQKMYYAVSSDYSTGKRRPIYLHRFVLDAPSGLDVDHREPEHTLDCRRCNLRLSTRSQNIANSRRRSGPVSSQYRGVCYHSRNRVWQASVRVCGRAIYLGSFRSEYMAARAYNAAALKYFGEFARLNKPGKGCG